MKKKTKEEHIGSISLYEMEGNIDHFINIGQKLKKEHGDVKLKVLSIGGEEIDIYKVRLETDKEFEKRKEKNRKLRETRKKNKIEKEKKERKLYEKLKEKFE